MKHTHALHTNKLAVYVNTTSLISGTHCKKTKQKIHSDAASLILDFEYFLHRKILLAAGKAICWSWTLTVSFTLPYLYQFLQNCSPVFCMQIVQMNYKKRSIFLSQISTFPHQEYSLILDDYSTWLPSWFQSSHCDCWMRLKLMLESKSTAARCKWTREGAAQCLFSTALP